MQLSFVGQTLGPAPEINTDSWPLWAQSFPDKRQELRMGLNSVEGVEGGLDSPKVWF